MNASENAPRTVPASGRALVWFSAALALFLAIRALTTLAAGASFDTPGDGWRSVWQLVIVALLVVGVAAPRWRTRAMVVVALVYLLATVSEAFGPAQLVGAIPVDMRDRIVHPLIGLLALAGALWAMRARGTSATAAR
jgi:hypothetical protein